MIRKTEDPDGAARGLVRMAGDLGTGEIAVVRNPGYVFQPYELYVLAPRRTTLRRLAAVVMDMDGTTTTTETLCLHSLETMVRRASGRLATADWSGLDPDRDYPHVIGNSTTRHVEYLVEEYGETFEDLRFSASFLHAAAWTLAHGRDPGRRNEVIADLAAFGLSGLLDNPAFLSLADRSEPDAIDPATALLPDHRPLYMLRDPVNRVRAAVDVYYTRYHEILEHLAAGGAEAVADEILGDPTAPVILPMPGVPVFLALVAGLLGETVGDLVAFAAPGIADEEAAAAAGRVLTDLGTRFAAAPARVAVVTSSIAYEAGIVLAEVFRAIRMEIARWPVADDLRARLDARFESPETFYDAVVTASDSSEIRLKPHRDLYSLAVHRLAIPRSRLDEVLGLEDSESGVTAIRAAGIGLSVAVPFSDTAGHDLSAASVIVKGGLPEVMIDRGCFLL